MRIVFYTYSYTDRLQLPISDTFARIASTGYSGIDESSTFGPHLNSESVSPERRRVIRETADRYGLRVEAIVTHGDLTPGLFRGPLLDLCGAIDLAADLGGDVATFHLGGPVEGVAEDVLWSRVIDEIRRAADHGDTRRVRLAIDVGPWPPWIVRTNDDLARLFADVGSESFGVNYDPCYMAVAGIDPVGFVDRFADRIRHVHIKDSIGRYPRFEHRIPGQGELDYAPIIKALDQAGYRASIAIEAFIDMELAETCDVGYATLRQAFDRAGVPFPRR